MQHSYKCMDLQSLTDARLIGILRCIAYTVTAALACLPGQRHLSRPVGGGCEQQVWRAIAGEQSTRGLRTHSAFTHHDNKACCGKNDVMHHTLSNHGHNHSHRPSQSRPASWLSCESQLGTVRIPLLLLQRVGSVPSYPVAWSTSIGAATLCSVTWDCMMGACGVVSKSSSLD